MVDPVLGSGILGSEVPPACSGMTHLSGHNRLQVSSPTPPHPSPITCPHPEDPRGTSWVCLVHRERPEGTVQLGRKDPREAELTRWLREGG